MSSKPPTRGSTGRPRPDPPGYAELFKEQGGRCAICWRPPTPGRRLTRDHDHVTGLLRGLLCISCNRFVIGRHHGTKGGQLLRRAGDYLICPPAELIDLVVDMGKGPVRKRRRRARHSRP